MAFLQNVQPQSQHFSSPAAAAQWLRQQGAVQLRDGTFRTSAGLIAVIEATARGAAVSFSGCAC